MDDIPSNTKSRELPAPKGASKLSAAEKAAVFTAAYDLYQELRPDTPQYQALPFPSRSAYVQEAEFQTALKAHSDSLQKALAESAKQSRVEVKTLWKVLFGEDI